MLKSTESEFCTACYTGVYPLELSSEIFDAKADDRQLDLWTKPDPDIVEEGWPVFTAHGEAGEDS